MLEKSDSLRPIEDEVIDGKIKSKGYGDYIERTLQDAKVPTEQAETILNERIMPTDDKPTSLEELANRLGSTAYSIKSNELKIRDAAKLTAISTGIAPIPANDPIERAYELATQKDPQMAIRFKAVLNNLKSSKPLSDAKLGESIGVSRQTIGQARSTMERLINAIQEGVLK